MGLFDTLHCDYPLPEARHQDLEFQTKSLDSVLDTYSITSEGLLLRHARRQANSESGETEVPFHGDIRFYTVNPRGSGLLEYVARFTHGRVEWILPLA